jgi:hypothetical protein
MYSPLNEDYMFQEMHDRVARMSARTNPRRGKDKPRSDAMPNRRWWRKAARVAG